MAKKSCTGITDSNSSTNPILLTSDTHYNAHSMPLSSGTLLQFPHGNTIESDLLFKEQIDQQYNALFTCWGPSLHFPAYRNGVYESSYDILQFVGSLKSRQQNTPAHFCSIN